MKKKFDPVVWARSTRRKTGGSMCSLCAAAQDVQEALATIIEMKQKGETVVSQAQVAKMLGDEYGMKLSTSTVHKHISVHLGAKW
jgi:hypothetical protein